MTFWRPSVWSVMISPPFGPCSRLRSAENSEGPSLRDYFKITPADRRMGEKRYGVITSHSPDETQIASDCPFNSLKCSTRQPLCKQLQAGCWENTEQQHLNLETSNTRQTTILLQKNSGSDSVPLETWNEQ